MRALAFVALAACSFEGHGYVVPLDGAPDAVDPSDASDAPVIDGPDLPPSQRVQDQLVALWTFDDPAGSSTAADTGSTAPVPLQVIDDATTSPPTFANGNLEVTSVGRVISPRSTHLTTDTASAVTLEAWVSSPLATQGGALEGRVIGGLASSVSLRDILLMQAGDKWVGRVRTTAALDGKPELVSTSTVTANRMTHLVLVADATRRTLYVDDVAEGGVGMTGAPAGWDLTHPMVLANEYQQARPWLGTFALVALYGKALSPAEIHQNFMLGPDAP